MTVKVHLLHTITWLSDSVDYHTCSIGSLAYLFSPFYWIAGCIATIVLLSVPKCVLNIMGRSTRGYACMEVCCHHMIPTWSLTLNWKAYWHAIVCARLASYPGIQKCLDIYEASTDLLIIDVGMASACEQRSNVNFNVNVDMNMSIKLMNDVVISM